MQPCAQTGRGVIGVQDPAPNTLSAREAAHYLATPWVRAEQHPRLGPLGCKVDLHKVDRKENADEYRAASKALVTVHAGPRVLIVA